MRDAAAEMLPLVDHVIRAECRRHSPPPVLDAEDLAQEARIAFVRSYDEHGPMPVDVARRWAKVETRRRCIDAIRNARFGRRKHGEMQKLLYSTEEVLAESDGNPVHLGDTLVNRSLEVDLGALSLREAVRRLPAKERIVVQGTVEGYRLHEIAAWFGFTESRAAQLLMKARVHLEEMA